MRFAARSPASGPRTGIPPPTAASKRSAAAGPPGDRLELRPVVGDDVLVGGDDALAHRQRGGDQGVGRLVAAHQLDDDVDLVAGHQVGRRVGDQTGRETRRDGAIDVPHGDRGQLERHAVARPAARPAARAARATTSRPTVPAPRTATRRGLPLMTWAETGRDIRRMVADGPERPPGECRRLHSRAMTTDLAPRAAPAEAPAARPRIFSGIQPSGVVHLGNDLGAIRNYVRLQSEYEAIYCIVDYHALTSTHDGDVLRQRTREMAASLLALGLDPELCTLFVQSHRPEVTELAWLLATVTPGLVARADADLQGEARAAARRRQPRPADLPGPAGRRHRHLQGVARAGRQGPGRPPRAVPRDRPRLQPPLRRDVPRAARPSTPSRRPSSAPTASGR